MPGLYEAIRHPHPLRGQPSVEVKLRDLSGHHYQAKAWHLSAEQGLTADSLQYFHRVFLSQLPDTYASHANPVQYLSQ